MREYTAAEILPLDPATYKRHAMHGDERAWPETNCYTDLWIELLHALKLDPVACMGFTLAMDFEGDQWTFFKPPLTDLHALYGIEMQELTIWRSVEQHTATQVALGRPVLVEVDAFFLPDTGAVSYRHAHTKTTIAVQQIDRAARTLGYFHNAGYFTLRDDDFDGIFGRPPFAPGDSALDPYTEIAKLTTLVQRPAPELARIAADLARAHVARLPRANPVERYRETFACDVEWLSNEPLEVFHQYAFATLRQCGASAELGATFLRWLEQYGEDGLESAASSLEALSASAKALQFKVARAVNTRKPTDFDTPLGAMQTAWANAAESLTAAYGR